MFLRRYRRRKNGKTHSYWALVESYRTGRGSRQRVVAYLGELKRGYSRDSRPDCLQVCIGLVVTDDGIPLGYEVFAGNRNDATTVEEVVEAMEKKYGRANRIWVMDRGMVSEDNLKFLRSRQGRYIVGTPKAMLRQFEEYLTRKDWHEVQEGVEVQTLAQWTRRSGLGDAPRTLLDELAKIKSGDVLLPTV